MAEVRLELPARPEYLSLARQVVAAAAALEPAFHDERIDDLRIAVSEATTNAIEAHTDLASAERIVIRCNLGDDRIEVEVVDQGAGFSPSEARQAPAATAEDRLAHERGLGIPLMRVLADEADITTGEGGTAVRLVVYTPAQRRALFAERGGSESRPTGTGGGPGGGADGGVGGGPGRPGAGGGADAVGRNG